ncbi:DUF6894 family protein [Sphingobium ummariense]|uniref:DUF6894 domain-containing protein n=1 Tax=Sphingobium ummariense RL-3 TaxID=1346791 RepID=T0IWD9_9SPHN|nr:hypothetical protein [Sphingobium ummariense]EQB30081.1 hypothetical protein M529_21750 [Sphingobium ummariense RL-3]
MTRYHLNLFNDTDILDEEGQDFPNIAAAVAEAVRSARDIIAEHVLTGRTIHLQHRMEVTDPEGRLLSTVRFGDVVRFEQ